MPSGNRSAATTEVSGVGGATKGGKNVLFDVVSDGGLDRMNSLENDLPVAPFTIQFGKEGFSASELPREEFFSRLERGAPHPTTAQPTPEQFAQLFRSAERQLLAVTISSALSGSLNAADQARAQMPTDSPVTLHDSGTLSAAQAFQVHAAMTARERGHDVDTAIDWMRQVHEETELYFTIDTLDYLRRGGRIGRVQATLGGLVGLRPIITVDKSEGAYTSLARARGWSKAVDRVARQVTTRFGEGTPLRVGLIYGAHEEDAQDLLGRLRERHPLIWHDVAAVGMALAVHTGPKAVGLAAAPGDWPWERR